jgi:hypothetical protein
MKGGQRRRSGVPLADFKLKIPTGDWDGIDWEREKTRFFKKNRTEKI